MFHGSHTFADADEPRAMFVHGARSREDDAWLKRLDGVSSQYKRAVGMYKVLGTTVEAAVGGVYHQFVSGCFPILYQGPLVDSHFYRRVAPSPIEYF